MLLSERHPAAKLPADDPVAPLLVKVGLPAREHPGDYRRQSPRHDVAVEDQATDVGLLSSLYVFLPAGPGEGQTQDSLRVFECRLPEREAEQNPKAGRGVQVYV